MPRRWSEHGSSVTWGPGMDSNSVWRAQLRERARARCPRLVLPEHDDRRVAWARDALAAEGLARPVALPRDREALAQRLRLRRAHRGMTAEQARLAVADPVLAAALMVGAGAADGLVAGAVVPSANVVRAALWGIGPAPGVSTVSGLFVMLFPDGRRLLFADCAVVPEPDSGQLLEIASAAARLAPLLLQEQARVALLSFSSHGSASHPAAARMAAVAAELKAREPELLVDGELQADAALVPDVAAAKTPDSPLRGRANVLVFPDLASGNIAYKLCQRLAGAAALGPLLLGLTRPVSDLSRGCDAETVLDVACLTALRCAAEPLPAAPTPAA